MHVSEAFKYVGHLPIYLVNSTVIDVKAGYKPDYMRLPEGTGGGYIRYD